MKITKIVASSLVIIAALVSLYFLLLYKEPTFMGMTAARVKDIWYIYFDIAMIIFGVVNAIANWKSKQVWLKYRFLVVSLLFGFIVVARLLILRP